MSSTSFCTSYFKLRTFIYNFQFSTFNCLTMPATAGYSNTSLIKKLGIQPGMKVVLLNQPDDYYDLLTKNIRDQLVMKDEVADLVHVFVNSMKEFDSTMKHLKKLIKKNTSLIIWVSWYKKSAKMNTDVTEDEIRNYALLNGLVDVKVCAVSEQWSGLKLVVPLKLR